MDVLSPHGFTATLALELLEKNIYYYISAVRCLTSITAAAAVL